MYNKKRKVKEENKMIYIKESMRDAKRYKRKKERRPNKI